MTIFRFSRALPLLLLAAGCATHPAEVGQAEVRQAEVARAEAIGAEFCVAAKQWDEARAERLMTSSLRAAIADLRRFDAEWQARNPGEKPPLGNGLRLMAWPDSPERCVPGAVTAGGMRAGSVVLAYVPAMAPTEGWEDRLVLVRGPDGRLMVGDIRYDAAVGGSFRQWIAETRRSPG